MIQQKKLIRERTVYAEMIRERSVYVEMIKRKKCVCGND